MTLGTPVITRASDNGGLVPKYMNYQAQDPVEMARVHDEPLLTVVVTTTTSDTGEIVDLTDYFDFLDDTLYKVKLVHRAATENDRYYQELEYMVVGRQTAATDPLIIGEGALSTGVQGKIVTAFGVLAGVAQSYGRVTVNGVLDAEATDGTNGHGLLIAAGSSGVYGLTLPLRRTAKPIAVHVEQETYSAAEASYGNLADIDSAGTPTIQTVQADDGTGGTNATAGTNLTATLDIYPPVNAFLVLDGTPDPGHVTVHILGIASDEVKHTVEVYITRAMHNPFFGS